MNVVIYCRNGQWRCTAYGAGYERRSDLVAYIEFYALRAQY